MSFNLAVILSETARSSPDRPVAVFTEGQLTYRQLDQASDRLAGSLAAIGIKPGEPVALQLPNIPQFLVSYFGILKAGGIVVPLNVMLRAPEVAFHLGDSGARVLITWEGILAEAAKGAEAAGLDQIYAVGHAGDSEIAVPFERLLDVAVPHFEMVTRQPLDTAVIVYTSGTTGRAQGRGAHPHAAVHERRHPGPPVRRPVRRHRDHGPAAVPRVRPVQHPGRLRAVRLHDVAGPQVHARRGADRDPAGPGHHLRGRAHHVRRPAVLPGPGRLRPVLAADRHLRRGVHPRARAGRVRGALRPGDPGRLWPDRDGVDDDLQHQRGRAPRLQRRQAHLGDADPGLGRSTAGRFPPGRSTWARSSPAACT